MIIFGILILGLILRLINLGQSLWLDEAVQAITARSTFAYIFQEIVGDFHPPLYYFLMHFWVRIFGSSEIALRMPSVLFGVGTVYLAYLIAKIIFPRTHYSLFFVHCSLPDLVALLLATAPFHIYYSQEARMYAMVTFLVTGSFYFLLRALENGKGNRGNWGNKGLYFLFILLALYTDYYAWLVFLAQGIYLLTQKKYKFLILNSCLPAGMALFLILCYLPWLPMLVTQLNTGILATQALPGWGKLVNLSFLRAIPLTFIKFSIGRISIFNKVIYTGVSGIIIGIYGFLILRVIKGWIRDGLKDAKGVIIAWFFVPLLTAWFLSLVVPNFQPFRLILILPAFYLFLLFGVFSFKSKALRCWLIVLVLIINLSSSAVYYFNPFFQREDWRGIVKYIKGQTGEAVILPSETSVWPIKYYDPDNQLTLVTPARRIEQVKKVVEIKGDKIFYIRYLVPLFDQQEKILAELGQAGYTKVKEISFNQIPVWEFTKK